MGHTRGALVGAVVGGCFLVNALAVGCASPASVTDASGSTSPEATATAAPTAAAPTTTQSKTAYPVVSVQCGAKDHPTPCVK